MKPARVVTLTVVSMVAFASNSILARVALKQTEIDATSFAAIRLISGAAVLLVAAHLARQPKAGRGSWGSATALFVYAAGFSFAYVSLPTATGALLLFGVVQVTMIVYGFWVGERLRPVQMVGLLLAFGGLLLFFLPGLSTRPPLISSLLMTVAGVCWGIYSLRGKGVTDPIGTSAGNFARSAVLAAALGVVMLRSLSLDGIGVVYAVTSGALTSGMGYVIWYTVMPALKATNAAIVQLSVPVIAAAGGVVFLGESVTVRLVLASIAIIGGIALVVTQKQARQPRQNSRRGDATTSRD